jgi:hypothetical protein
MEIGPTMVTQLAPAASQIDWWAGGGGAIVGAIVGAIIGMFAAALQDWIRSLFFRPKFEVTTDNAPPCSVVMPVTDNKGVFLWNSLYLRIYVKNVGSAVARDVEVYAQSLQRLGKNSSPESVKPFPPQNLGWAHTPGNTPEQIYFPIISPGMGRYCDVAYVTDPVQFAKTNKARGSALHEAVLSSSSSSGFGVSVTYTAAPPAPKPHQDHNAQPAGETKMGFMVRLPPNNQGNIVGPGTFLLKVLVAAENRRPIVCTLEIFHAGTWNADEDTMLRDHANMKVLKTRKARVT